MAKAARVCFMDTVKSRPDYLVLKTKHMIQNQDSNSPDAQHCYQESYKVYRHVSRMEALGLRLV